MCTGNLLSLFYPLSVLLYALLEDPRPKNKYWSIVLIYAELIILFKFLIQQNALTVLTPGSLFVEIVDKFKLGFKVYDKKEYARGIFGFIIWDILVALSVLLHQHCLVLIGLWKKRESDIESVEEAKKRIQAHIQRKHFEERIKFSPEKGMTIIEEDKDDYDSDDLNLKPKLNYKSAVKADDATPEVRLNSVKSSMKNFKREKSLGLPKLNVKFESLAKEAEDEKRPSRKTTEMNLHNKFDDSFSISDEELVRYSANYFIHDYSSDTEGGSNETCEARIQVIDDENYSTNELPHKNMSENDIRYYEGIDEEGIIGMQNALIMDYYDENPEKHRIKDKLTFKELVLKNEFILRIFPRQKQQKPGIDLYNIGVVFQFLIVIYILFFFSQMTGEKEELSETFKFKRFRAEMIFFMFIQIMLILLDRFFYISNTFDQIDNELEEDENINKSIINNILKSENKHNFIKLMVYIALVFLVHF